MNVLLFSKEMSHASRIRGCARGAGSWRAIWILVLGFCLLGPIRASHDTLFETVSLEDGLSQSVVNCVFQDRQGFLWFGTDDGLNLYDGMEFIVFRNDPFDPTTLGNNGVNVITQDSTGLFWIGTNGGISRMDPATRVFTPLAKTHPIMNTAVSSILEDPSGILWIGTFSGLYRTLPGGSDLEEVPPPAGQADSGARTIRVLFRDSQGTLWIGSEAGLDRVDPESEDRHPFHSNPSADTSINIRGVRAIDEDADGHLWVGTFGFGLFHLDEDRNIVSVFRRTPDDPKSLSNDRVTAIREDRSGHLWIGTWNGGLNQLDRSSGAFRHWRHDPEQEHGLSGNYLATIFEDRSGILWIGTSGGGISKLDLDRPRFTHYAHDPSNPNSLNDSFVWALFEDQDGILWIGTDSGGLNRLDRKTGLFSAFQPDPTDPNALGHHEVRAIVQDASGTMWIGMIEAGVDRFDPESGRFTHFRHDPENPNSLSSDRVYGLTLDGQGHLWIGTADAGLNRLDLATRAFSRFRHDPDDPQSLGNDTINAILPITANAMWIGTDGGLDRFDSSQRTFQHFVHDPQSPESLSYRRVSCLLQDSHGTLWAGTYGGGLNRLDGDEGRFTHFTEHDGLANNSIYGMLEDDSGCLWLSTNGGLSKFDPKTRSFTNYDVRDGLQSNEFDRGAFFKSPSGEMFFGGINGLNAFFPKQIKSNPFVPPVVITDFKLFSKPVPIGPDQVLTRHISQAQEITLTYRQNVFSFEFAALNYRMPNKNQYAYKMEGFDRDWNESGNRRFVSYTNLPHGTYTFRVKGSNNDGLWNDQGASIRLRITPPFWKTTWFLLLCAATVLATLIAIFKIRVHALESRRAELERDVRLRTHELEAEKDRVQERNRELQDKNRELETLDLTIQAINREVDLESLLRTILHRAGELFPQAEKGAFLIRDGDRFQYGAVVGYDEAIFRDVSYPAHEALARYASENTQLDQGVNLIQEFDGLPTPPALVDVPAPKSMLTMSVTLNDRVEGFLVLDNAREAHAFQDSDLTKLKRFRSHAISAVEKAKRLQELKETAQHLKETRDRVIETAHLAGMADLAANVLHEIGNSVNSLNISLGIARELLDNPNLGLLRRIVEIVGEHRQDLATFLTSHNVGKNLPEILSQLLESFERMNERLSGQVAQLAGQVERINDILRAQRDLAFQGGIRQRVDVNTLLEEVLEIQQEHLAKAGLDSITEFQPLPMIKTQKSKLMYVFVCLINHAIQILDQMRTDVPPRLTLRTRTNDDRIQIEFEDNGLGLSDQDRKQLFQQGSTADINGMGLHTCANAIAELGGMMKLQSSQQGRGSLTTIDLPVNG